MKKLLIMMMIAMLSFGLVVAQTRVITGKVTDSKGNPVPGATIKTKSGETVAADQNGAYKINVVKDG
jgi:protocatechuate 3,4-dioxygenase beta subunit